uniref:Uncharacterized protein n=1 Tax=Polynucleobacter necessarius subsp. necessarius (strain STIR1) TaxID=452638 RepID=B1XS98_POLNS
MLTWMKRLVAGGAMALAIGATSVMDTSPAHADEVKTCCNNACCCRTCSSTLL